MPETKRPKEAAKEVSMQLQADPSVAQGRYATMVMASMGDHECQLTFVAQDLLVPPDQGVVGQVVARVYLANARLRSLADLLVRQADLFDKRNGAGTTK